LIQQIKVLGWSLGKSIFVLTDPVSEFQMHNLLSTPPVAT
jgi:hypothetical protein